MHTIKYPTERLPNNAATGLLLAHSSLNQIRHLPSVRDITRTGLLLRMALLYTSTGILSRNPDSGPSGSRNRAWDKICHQQPDCRQCNRHDEAPKKPIKRIGNLTATVDSYDWMWNRNTRILELEPGYNRSIDSID
eukprot:scaffold6272_cov86-Cylindrotheca_fusiformis.AAC.3